MNSLYKLEQEQQAVLEAMANLHICGTKPVIIIHKNGTYEFDYEWINEKDKKLFNQSVELLKFLSTKIQKALLKETYKEEFKSINIARIS